MRNFDELENRIVEVKEDPETSYKIISLLDDVLIHLIDVNEDLEESEGANSYLRDAINNIKIDIYNYEQAIDTITDLLQKAAEFYQEEREEVEHQNIGLMTGKYQAFVEAIGIIKSLTRNLSVAERDED